MVSSSGDQNGYDIGSGHNNSNGGSLTLKNNATVNLNRNGTNTNTSFIDGIVGGDGAVLLAGTYSSSQKLLTCSNLIAAPSTDVKAFDNVKLTAYVTGLSETDPQGQIAFFDNSLEIGRASLIRIADGSAEATADFIWSARGGIHMITAHYVQDYSDSYYMTNSGKLEDYEVAKTEQAPLTIRYHAGRGTNTLPRHEGSTIPEDMLETTEEFLKDCERLISLYHDPNPLSMRQIVIAPCQPINCYPETFKESVALARKHGVRMHTHLGEGENPIMLERFGKRTLQWCEEMGFIGPDVWVAHDWEIIPEEYAVMAKYQTGISHCPGPAILGGFPILNIKELLDAGISVSLGCDGSATNDSSSLLDSLRTAYLMQAYHSKQRGGSASAYDMLKVATVEGAKTLGRPDLGSLEIGKAADLFMIDTEVLELTGTLHDPKHLLARVGVTGPVWLTMINGKVVYKDGHLAGVDERVLARAGEAVCDRVLRDNLDAFHNL